MNAPKLPPPPPPQPLDYSPYRASRADNFDRNLRYIAGLLLAMFVVAVIGCLGYRIPIDPNPRQPPEPMLGHIIGFFIVAVIAGVALVVAIVAGDKERRRWFLLGLLTGLCLAALMEGACFAN